MISAMFYRKYGRWPTSSVDDRTALETIRRARELQYLVRAVMETAIPLLEERYHINVAAPDAEKWRADAPHYTAAIINAHHALGQVDLAMCRALKARYTDHLGDDQAFGQYVDTDAVRAVIKVWREIGGKPYTDDDALAYLKQTWARMLWTYNTPDSPEQLERQADALIAETVSGMNNPDIAAINRDIMFEKLRTIMETEIESHDPAYQAAMKAVFGDPDFASKEKRVNVDRKEWWASKLKTMNVRVVDPAYTEVYSLLQIPPPPKRN